MDEDREDVIGRLAEALGLATASERRQATHRVIEARLVELDRLEASRSVLDALSDVLAAARARPTEADREWAAENGLGLDGDAE